MSDLDSLLQGLDGRLGRLAALWARRLPHSPEDLLQEARVAVVTVALATWVASGCSFPVWAERAARQRFMKIAQAEATQKRGAGYRTISLNTPVGDDPSSGERLTLGDTLADPRVDVEGEALANIEREERLRRLSPRQRVIFQRVEDGYETAEIARMLSLTPAQVSRERAMIHTRLSEEENS